MGCCNLDRVDGLADLDAQRLGPTNPYTDPCDEALLCAALGGAASLGACVRVELAGLGWTGSSSQILFHLRHLRSLFSFTTFLYPSYSSQDKIIRTRDPVTEQLHELACLPACLRGAPRPLELRISIARRFDNTECQARRRLPLIIIAFRRTAHRCPPANTPPGPPSGPAIASARRDQLQQNRQSVSSVSLQDRGQFFATPSDRSYVRLPPALAFFATKGGPAERERVLEPRRAGDRHQMLMLAPSARLRKTNDRRRRLSADYLRSPPNPTSSAGAVNKTPTACLAHSPADV